MILKRMLPLVLAAALTLGLAACAAPGSSGEKKPESEQEKLVAILDSVAEDVHPGTAGSGMAAIRTAAKLVLWAARTDMDTKEAAKTVVRWVQELPQEKKDAVKEQLTMVAESYAQIAVDGAKDMLASAGVEEDLSNLGQRMKDLVEAVLESGGLDR